MSIPGLVLLRRRSLYLCWRENCPGMLEAQPGQDAPEDDSLNLQQHSVCELRAAAAWDPMASQNDPYIGAVMPSMSISNGMMFLPCDALIDRSPG